MQARHRHNNNNTNNQRCLTKLQLYSDIKNATLKDKLKDRIT